LLEHTYERELIQSAGEDSASKYRDSPVPTKSCVPILIKKWRTTGSVLDKTLHRKKTVLTDEKLEDIRARLEICPRKSLRRLCIGSASKATKFIKFRPYRVRVLHELKTVDAPQRIRFCNWMLKNMHDGLVDPQLLFITDEA
jgi:hypothetical protein